MAAKPGTSPTSDDRPTDTMRWIGQYQVIGEIGRGAEGTVYRALDPAIGREVAINPTFAVDGDFALNSG